MEDLGKISDVVSYQAVVGNIRPLNAPIAQTKKLPSDENKDNPFAR